MAFKLLHLPTELLLNVIDKVAEEGPEQHHRLRIVCRKLKDIIEPSMAQFFKTVDFSKSGKNITMTQFMLTFLGRTELGLIVEQIHFFNQFTPGWNEVPFDLNPDCFILSKRDIDLLSSAIHIARVPGDAEAWLKKLEENNEPAVLKLLLTLVPNLKELWLKAGDLGCYKALNQIATAVIDEESGHLSRLENLTLDNSRSNRDLGLPLNRFPSILQLPALRTLILAGVGVQAYEVFSKECDREDSYLHRLPLYENEHLRIEVLDFSDSFIGPTYIAEVLTACSHLRSFKWTPRPSNGCSLTEHCPTKLPELCRALAQHERTLETLKLPTILEPFRSYYAFYGPTATNTILTIGSLANFTTLKHLDIEQVDLLDLHDRNQKRTCDCRDHCHCNERVYCLHHVLPCSIQKLRIRECKKSIIRHLICLRRLRETNFQKLTTIHIVPMRSRYYSITVNEIERKTRDTIWQPVHLHIGPLDDDRQGYLVW